MENVVTTYIRSFLKGSPTSRLQYWSWKLNIWMIQVSRKILRQAVAYRNIQGPKYQTKSLSQDKSSCLWCHLHIKSFWDKKCCDLAIQLSVSGQRVNFRWLVCTCVKPLIPASLGCKKKQTEWKLRHPWNLLVPIISWISFSQGPMQLDRRAQILTVPFYRIVGHLRC